MARFYIVLPACPSSEGGTISRVNCAPSEGEGVSENVAVVPVCVGRRSNGSYLVGAKRQSPPLGEGWEGSTPQPTMPEVWWAAYLIRPKA